MVTHHVDQVWGINDLLTELMNRVFHGIEFTLNDSFEYAHPVSLCSQTVSFGMNFDSISDSL